MWNRDVAIIDNYFNVMLLISKSNKMYQVSTTTFSETKLKLYLNEKLLKYENNLLPFLWRTSRGVGRKFVVRNKWTLSRLSRVISEFFGEIDKRAASEVGYCS